MSRIWKSLSQSQVPYLKRGFFTSNFFHNLIFCWWCSLWRQGSSTGIYDNRLDIFPNRATGDAFRPPMYMPRNCPWCAPIQVSPTDRINNCLIQLEEIFSCKSIRCPHVLTSIVAFTWWELRNQIFIWGKFCPSVQKKFGTKFDANKIIISLRLQFYLGPMMQMFGINIL